MKLSIAMIVKNEEENIEESLASFKKIESYMESEIIVVDTGSTDNTVDLAKKHTEKVYFHEWTGNFAEMRNISIRYCTGDWILVVDADEVLEDEIKLVNFFKNHENKYNSVAINIISKSKSSKDKVLNEGRLVRLFRNKNSFKYEGIIHEQPKYEQPLLISDINFLHYGYDTNDYKLMNYKFERNVKLLNEVLKTENDNPYIFFQLAQSYFMANKNVEALEYIEKAFNLSNKKDHKTLYIYHLYANLLEVNGRFDQSIYIIKEAIRLGAQNIDFYYFLGKNYAKLGEYDLSLIYYEKYLSIVESKKNMLAKDNNITTVSYGKKDDVIKYMFNVYIAKNNYDEILNKYKSLSYILKKELKDHYIIASIMKGKYKNIVKLLNEKDDINSKIEVINSRVRNLKKKEREIFYNILHGNDDKIDIYLNTLVIDNVKNPISVDYNIFYNWKAEILKKELFKNSKAIEKIKYLENEDINKYIKYLSGDYLIIDMLIKYSKENLFNTNLDELNLCLIIEEILITLDSIIEKDYEDLVIRILYNKVFYFKYVYNDYLNMNEKLLNNSEDKFFIRLIKAIKNKDKLTQIKDMKNIVKIYPEKKRIYQVIMDKFIEKNINNKELEIEKENIINLAENYINLNKVDEGLILLEEALNIFKNDKRIINNIVVCNFINGNIKNTYENLAFILINDENYIEALYNIALILEKENRIQDSIFYYEKIIISSKDELIIEEVKIIIDNLRKKYIV